MRKCKSVEDPEKFYIQCGRKKWSGKEKQSKGFKEALIMDFGNKGETN